MDLRAQLQEWSHAFQTLALRKHIHFVLDVNDDRTEDVYKRQSYNITKDLKVWASFRYFSKTYANIKKAY